MNIRTNTPKTTNSTKLNVHKDNIALNEAYWLEVAQDLKELSEILIEVPNDQK